MKTHNLCIVLLIMISRMSFAQQYFSNEQLHEDFTILENILKQGHPSIYEYIDKNQLDSIFIDTKASLTEKMSDIEFYKRVVSATDQIKDGSLLVFAPKTINTEQYYFPLLLKIINTNFYIDTDDFGIPIGSKILSINNKNINRILETLKKYAPSDGNNLNKKYRDIEQKFGLYYLYEYGIHQEFTIRYSEPQGTEKTIVLPAESFTIVKHRNTKRSSYFAKYHLQEKGSNFFNKYVNSPVPYVFYKNNLKTAVLVVNSFNIEVNVFNSRLALIFEEINKKKIKHLIIDIRNNIGGNRANSIRLFSYISSTLFKQRINSFVSSLDIPEKNYLIRKYLNEKEFLKDKFYGHPTYNGWKLNFDDLEAIMVPHKNRFQGNIYVLTGGNTSATASEFAILAKNATEILLIGEETGTGYYFHMDEFPVYYELPNSKIELIMFMEKITHFVKDKTISNGSGLIPDRKISLSVQDLIDGKDTQLDYVLRLIGG